MAMLKNGYTNTELVEASFLDHSVYHAEPILSSECHLSDSYFACHWDTFTGQDAVEILKRSTGVFSSAMLVLNFFRAHETKYLLLFSSHWWTRECHLIFICSVNHRLQNVLVDYPVQHHQKTEDHVLSLAGISFSNQHSPFWGIHHCMGEFSVKCGLTQDSKIDVKEEERKDTSLLNTITIVISNLSYSKPSCWTVACI